MIAFLLKNLLSVEVIIIALAVAIFAYARLSRKADHSPPMYAAIVAISLFLTGASDSIIIIFAKLRVPSLAIKPLPAPYHLLIAVAVLIGVTVWDDRWRGAQRRRKTESRAVDDAWPPAPKK